MVSIGGLMLTPHQHCIYTKQSSFHRNNAISSWCHCDIIYTILWIWVIGSLVTSYDGESFSVEISWNFFISDRIFVDFHLLLFILAPKVNHVKITYKIIFSTKVHENLFMYLWLNLYIHTQTITDWTENNTLLLAELGWIVMNFCPDDGTRRTARGWPKLIQFIRGKWTFIPNLWLRDIPRATLSHGERGMWRIELKLKSIVFAAVIFENRVHPDWNPVCKMV